MPYTISTPSGVSITKTLSEEEVTKLKADSYFTVEPQSNSLDDFFSEMKPTIRIHKNLEPCESCSA